MLSLLVLIGLIHILGNFFGYQPPVSDVTRYGPPSNATNEFVTQFEEVLLNDLGYDIHHRFVTLIFEDGQIICRRKHRHQLGQYRTRHFTQMVRKGLSLQNHSSINMDDGLPILVLEDDGNGCNIHFHRDDHEFPRLAWSMLSPKHGACKADELWY